MIRPLERIADLLRVADIRSAAELLDLPGQLLNSHKLLPLLVGVDGIAQIPHHPPQLVAIHAPPPRYPSSSVNGTPRAYASLSPRPYTSDASSDRKEAAEIQYLVAYAVVPVLSDRCSSADYHRHTHRC